MDPRSIILASKTLLRCTLGCFAVHKGKVIDLLKRMCAMSVRTMGMECGRAHDPGLLILIPIRHSTPADLPGLIHHAFSERHAT